MSTAVVKLSHDEILKHDLTAIRKYTSDHQILKTFIKNEKKKKKFTLVVSKMSE